MKPLTEAQLFAAYGCPDVPARVAERATPTVQAFYNDLASSKRRQTIEYTATAAPAGASPPGPRRVTGVSQ